MGFAGVSFALVFEVPCCFSKWEGADAVAAVLL
jgi:hypothetical protein